MIDAVVGMGHTVTAGAMTTMGAGVVMLACQMIFFVKMAKLIVMVILFSLVYALGFFLPLCALVGPERGMGDIGWIPTWMRHKCLSPAVPVTPREDDLESVGGNREGNVENEANAERCSNEGEKEENSR